jgi:hypothetical protein
MPNIVDRFNVGGQDYYIEPVLDQVPTEGSPRPVMSGGVYQELIATRGDTPMASGVDAQGAFTRQGAYKYLSWIMEKIGIGKWQDPIYASASALSINAIIFANNLFVAATTTGCWWSEDGITWRQGVSTTSTSTAITDMNVSRTAVAYGNGLFVCGGYNSVDTLWWSTDGKVWNKSSGYTLSIQYVDGIAYDVTMGWYVSSYRQAGAVSSDGKTWTTDSNRFALNQIASNGSLWVGGHSTYQQDGAPFYSADGVTWSSGLSLSGIIVYQVIHANGLWLCGCNQGMFYANILNATHHFRAATMLRSGYYSVRAINYAFGVFVAAVTEGEQASDKGIWYSTDGINWTQCTGDIAGVVVTDIVYGDDKLIAVGALGCLWYSIDGINWTALLHLVTQGDTAVYQANLNCSHILNYGGDNWVLGINAVFKWCDRYLKDSLPLL